MVHSLTARDGSQSWTVYISHAKDVAALIEKAAKAEA
jgi:hypothetical protein